ncbi:hypothetical protein [Yinghuangia soli]|uniref:Uncharacterized protein n=1 Tax=Yinghuangia soli TaxID=2908204 RepID=A0AA41Q0G2_9ACTN|nr:hypothetical protein [Yinghuangia soli]MCF2529294.1 hypothetical protein [Yinghuangia soli]
MTAYRDHFAGLPRGARAPRVVALVAAAAGLCGLLAAAPAAQGRPAIPPPEPVDLYEMVTRDLGALPDTGYEAPDAAVRDGLRTGLDRVIARDWQGADDALYPRGYSGTVQQDVPSGVYFGRVFPYEHPTKGWGSAYVMGLGTSVAVQVPHPGCAPGIERFGVEVARGVPESVLLLAGAKRYAGGPEGAAGCTAPAVPKGPAADCAAAADPSSCTGTVFHMWSEFLRERAMPAVRLDALPADLAVADVEVDLPEGAEPTFAEAVAAAAESGGFTVCRSWVDVCLGAEEGLYSQQALAHGKAGAPFAAVQVRQSVLDVPVDAALVAKAVATGAREWKAPAAPPAPEPAEPTPSSPSPSAPAPETPVPATPARTPEPDPSTPPADPDDLDLTREPIVVTDLQMVFPFHSEGPADHTRARRR